VDGDGIADIVIGGPGESSAGTGAGAVWLLSGDTVRQSTSLSLDDALYTFTGEGTGDAAGYSVALIDDVDEDGLSDILIGAYLNDDVGADAGKAYLILSSSLGSDTELSLSSADYQFRGESAGDYAAAHVANAGDVDGDGLGDFMMGARLNDSGGADAGAAYIFLGGNLDTTTTIGMGDADYVFTGNRGSKLGASVAGVGDVDGDGFDDVLFGSIGTTDGGDNAGGAHLLRRDDLMEGSGGIDRKGYKFVGESEGDQAGWSVAGAGDVDGDGRADFLIGAPQDDDGGTNAGAVYVFKGSSLGASTTIGLEGADYKLVGSGAGYKVGGSVSSAGDMDGDDYDDIVVSQRVYEGSPSGKGAVYLLLADSLDSTTAIDLASADYVFTGQGSADAGGTGLTTVGDLNGDGLSDLLIGAPGNDDAASNAGMTYLVLAESGCNTEPTAPEVSIAPTSPTAGEDDLICSIDEDAYDPDGDSVTYTFEWEVDGVSFTGATTTTETGDTVAADELSGDEVWTCTVTPDDGTTEGDSASSSVTVEGASCSADSQTYTTPASSTFTVPEGCTILTVTLWGSGGGGGSGCEGCSYGGAGGGGGYISGLMSVSAGETYTVTVGEGGSGARAGGFDGGDGDTTSFSTFFSVSGAGGGASGGTTAVGGSGGVATGPDEPGETGGDGESGSFESWATGGDCAGIGGGRGGGNVHEGGRSAGDPGGGGGSGGASGQTGGDGGDGQVTIAWSD